MAGTSLGPPADWREFRRRERERLRVLTRSISAARLHARSSAIVDALSGRLRDAKTSIIGVYWPLPGEPDLRSLMTSFLAEGKRIVLPVVERRHAPLVYREWTETTPLEKGPFGIREPVAGRVLSPDVVIAPCVGFDRQRFRLGNGGGYFDRTLADRDSPSAAIGVAFDETEIPTIHPQAHDVAMDLIVTELRIIGDR